MAEEWRDMYGYEDRYSISSEGRVWSKTRHRYMGERVGSVGYVLLSLRQRDSPAKQESLHRRVALTFIPNPEGKPQVNHIDGDKRNNRVENLEWCTSSENNKHAFVIGHRDSKGSKNAMSKLTEADVTWMRENRHRVSRKEMAEKFGISPKYASEVVAEKTTWSHLTSS